jgi:hypothetical protein
MPADLALRLTRALSAASGPSASPVGTHPSRVGPGHQRPTPSRPGKWRTPRRRALVAGLASVLALVCGLGWIASMGGWFVGGTSSEDAAGAPEVPYSFAPTPAVDGSRLTDIFATGTDYRRDTLAGVASLPEGGGVELGAPNMSSAGLSRLASDDGFTDCTDAVSQRYPGQAVVADFARYEGSPALVLLIRQGTGSVVVAVGAGCGQDGDIHELAAIQID